jgi:hypothetical protein
MNHFCPNCISCHQCIEHSYSQRHMKSPQFLEFKLSDLATILIESNNHSDLVVHTHYYPYYRELYVGL